MRPSLLQLGTTAPMNLKPALRSVHWGWRRSGQVAQALLSFCVTLITLYFNRYQTALVLVCGPCCGPCSALASRYGSEQWGGTGLSEPWGDGDEPRLVHRWTLMLLSLSFSPFCPSCHLTVPSKGCQIRTTCSSLATVKHREITASTSLPAKPSRRWDNHTPVCHLAALSVCLHLLSVCLYCVSVRVLWNHSLTVFWVKLFIFLSCDQYM